ncbi:MAG: hypothetical protein KDD01_10585 [Phaeodactylibacter sp.]|nr:hypothetical protein [Phaeodactylibacter sp.]MCB0611994.1 hypothetical protein [Phaeodactylibacter sp.]MCB9304599.1 hypothetical protein [Lewinellaceae bacterium]
MMRSHNKNINLEGAKYHRSKTAPFFSNKNSQSFFNPSRIYPKLVINKSENQYERQANAMVEGIGSLSKPSADLVPGVQKKCSGCLNGERLQRQEGEGAPCDSYEPAHTIQQSALSTSTPSIQRLIREPYPWDGYVTMDRAPFWDETIRGRLSGTNLSASPSSMEWPDPICYFNRGTRVEVQEAIGNFLLRVRHPRRGTLYVPHEYIDDPTSFGMQRLLGRQAVWTTSELERVTPEGIVSIPSDFRRWALADTEASPPDITSGTFSLNCWELIMYAAYRMNDLSWRQIHDLYSNRSSIGAYDLIRRGSTLQNIRLDNQGRPVNLRIQRGDLVFFNGTEHVTLATGSGEGVYSYWPLLNRRPQDVDRSMFENIRIENISYINSRWNELYDVFPRVTYGSPFWR